MFTQAFLLFLRLCHGGCSSCMFSVLSAVLSLQLCLVYPSQETPLRMRSDLSFPHVHHKNEDTPPPPPPKHKRDTRQLALWSLHNFSATRHRQHTLVGWQTSDCSLAARPHPPTLAHPVTTRSLFRSQHTPSLSW